MNRPFLSWIGAAVCVLAAGQVSIALAADASFWKDFAVGQASYQDFTNPFEEDPVPPSRSKTAPQEPKELQRMAEEPAEVMPPDPAYQIPAPATPSRRIQPPAPLVPPDTGTIPPPPAIPSETPIHDELWQADSSAESCYCDSSAGCCETCDGSPFQRAVCDMLHRARCEDCNGCGDAGLRHGGLPLGIRWEGWIAQGATLNTESPNNRSNFPVTFNDGSNEYQMNQLYLVAERAVRKDAFSVGGRVDLLYGTDHRYTMARGLELERDLSPKWNSEDYGLSVPQGYMEVFAPYGTGVSVKMGHFYTILGYETVPAPENFFYSHSYAMQYGEPFTHTGALAATEVGPFKFQAGFTRGWDNWENNDDEYGFLGGMNWTSYDERTSLALALHTGKEEGVLSPATNTRTTYSMVFSHDFYGPWSCVVQHDMGIDRHVIGNGDDAKWYGVNMYLFREINECWKFGYRFEWFRDNDGTRVVRGERADYYEMAWGLNYTPNDRLSVRPSIRWDWTGARGSHPYVDGTRDDQLLLDCDVLIRF